MCRSTMRVLTPLDQLGRLAYHLYTNDAETTDECRCPSVYFMEFYWIILPTCNYIVECVPDLGLFAEFYIFLLLHNLIRKNQYQNQHTPLFFHTFPYKNAIKNTLFKTSVFYLFLSIKKGAVSRPNFHFIHVEL